MADGTTFWERWRAYRPSKAGWFWSCIACVVLTMIVGFTWGGWVTGGSATEMASKAADQARAELVATACVKRFLGAADATAQLASLKETREWQRSDFIEKGGWANLPWLKKPVDDAAGICADRLAEMKAPPAKTQETRAEESTTTTIQ